MSASERAFNVLLDLGLIEQSSDHEDPNYFSGNDEDYNEEDLIAIEASENSIIAEEKPNEEERSAAEDARIAEEKREEEKRLSNRNE